MRKGFPLQEYAHFSSCNFQLNSVLVEIFRKVLLLCVADAINFLVNESFCDNINTFPSGLIPDDSGRPILKGRT